MAVALDFRQTGSDPANLTTYPFPGVDIGGPGKHAVLVHTRMVNDLITVTSATLGGVAASSIQNQTTGVPHSNCVALLVFDGVPGTTADLVINCSGEGLRLGFGLWRLTGAGEIAYEVESSNDPSQQVTIPAGGAMIAGLTTATYPGTVAWTNATERYDTEAEGILHLSGADRVSAAEETVTIGADLSAGAPNTPTSLYAVISPAETPAATKLRSPAHPLAEFIDPQAKA